jgi:molecular chaperone GrpE
MSSDSSAGDENPNTATTAENPLKLELEKAKSDYLYLKAEFENYKKHAIKDRSELLKYGGERMIVELLGALDNFERALSVQVTAENYPTFVQGVAMTQKELSQLLVRFGVQEVPALGAAFDPLIHEALSFEETSEFSEGQVCRVFRKPFKMHDKVIRIGQVVVAKKPVVN